MNVQSPYILSIYSVYKLNNSPMDSALQINNAVLFTFIMICYLYNKANLTDKDYFELLRLF